MGSSNVHAQIGKEGPTYRPAVRKSTEKLRFGKGGDDAP